MIPSRRLQPVGPLACAILISRWWNVGNLLASVVLKARANTHPLDYKTSIYVQFGMIGLSTLIFIFLPETPCEYFFHSRWSPADDQGGRYVKARWTKRGGSSTTILKGFRGTMLSGSLVLSLELLNNNVNGRTRRVRWDHSLWSKVLI